jgi:hypothetical protein
VHIHEKDNTVFYECRAKELADIWVEAVDGKSNWIGGDSSYLGNGGNEDFYGSQSDAYNAYAKDEFDLSQYHKASFLKNVREIGSVDSVRRKRHLDDHDGDWDMDRKWDTKPFHNTYREESRKRIHVDCEMCCSAWVGIKAIRRYGILCFTLIKRLEELGFLVDVSISWNSRSVFSKGNKDFNAKGTFWVKRAGEYQSTSNFAKYFTEYFYRRVIFASNYYVGHKLNYNVSYTLGHVNAPPFSSKPGFIQMSPGTFAEVLEAGRTINTEQLSKVVQKAIAL